MSALNFHLFLGVCGLVKHSGKCIYLKIKKNFFSPDSSNCPTEILEDQKESKQ